MRREGKGTREKGRDRKKIEEKRRGAMVGKEGR